MSSYVSRELKIPIMPQTVFTDSKCVLEWYKSRKSLKRFVMDRIEDIRTYEVVLKDVKLEDNPADIATRGEGWEYNYLVDRAPVDCIG